MTPYVKSMRKKGWSGQEVAERWGITARQISRVARNPSQKDWDALAGLPNRSDVNVYVERNSNS